MQEKGGFFMISKTNKIRCPRCKQMYEFGGSAQDVSFCPECLVNDRKMAIKIKHYVADNKGCSVAKLTEEFGISTKQVKYHLKNDAIEILGDGKSFLLCEKCSNPINSGRLCDKCAE